MRDHELRDEVNWLRGKLIDTIKAANKILKAHSIRIEELENPTKKCKKCGQKIK